MFLENPIRKSNTNRWYVSALFSLMRIVLSFSHFVVVQSLSRVWLFATPWLTAHTLVTAAHQGSLSFTSSQSLLKLMSIEPVVPSNYLIPCYPLLLLSIFSSIRVFSNESTLHIRWSKYWCFSVSLSSESSGLISLRIDFYLFAVQGTLKSLLQHHSSKASIPIKLPKGREYNYFPFYWWEHRCREER